MISRTTLALAAACLAQFSGVPSLAQSLTASTYQGRLTEGSGPVNGLVTLQLSLFDSPTEGSPIADAVTIPDINVTDGLFTVDYDFGPSAEGRTGWIEVAVADGESVTVLSPRQRLAPTPLANALTSSSRVDVDNTASPADGAIYGGGGITPAYLSFRAQTSGPLSGITMRGQFLSAYSPTFYADVHAGQGTSGSLLGSVAQTVPITTTSSEFTLDLSSLNITVTEGQWYSVTVLCGIYFSATNQPVEGSVGLDRIGNQVNWWFRSLVQRPNRAFVSQAHNAFTAATAQQAQTAEVALTADSALALYANSPATMNDHEIRLRGSSDSNNGLGYFNGPRFGSINGPVLYGEDGGALGAFQSDTASIAMRWTNRGDIIAYNDATVDRNLYVSGSGGFGGSLTVYSSVGIGTAVSPAGYRLELPNTASPAGQGRANAWVTYSSRKFKDQIETFPDAISTLNKLRGVTFVWNTPLPDGTLKHDIGFIAEEVAQAAPELVTRTAAGDATGLDYGKVVPITVEAIKAQQRQLEALQLQNAQLQARLERLELDAQSNR